MTEAEAAALGGYYVEYRGTTHAVLFAGETLGRRRRGGRQTASPTRSSTAATAGATGSKLPVDSLARRFRRTVEATWQGEPVTVVGPLVDGTVLVRLTAAPLSARRSSASRATASRAGSGASRSTRSTSSTSRRRTIDA